jgi:predicted Ser/Thr protein kinase
VIFQSRIYIIDFKHALCGDRRNSTGVHVERAG